MEVIMYLSEEIEETLRQLQNDTGVRFKLKVVNKLKFSSKLAKLVKQKELEGDDITTQIRCLRIRSNNQLVNWTSAINNISPNQSNLIELMKYYNIDTVAKMREMGIDFRQHVVMEIGEEEYQIFRQLTIKLNPLDEEGRVLHRMLKYFKRPCDFTATSNL